jgi:hypothetical protein
MPRLNTADNCQNMFLTDQLNGWLAASVALAQVACDAVGKIGTQSRGYHEYTSIFVSMHTLQPQSLV